MIDERDTTRAGGLVEVAGDKKDDAPRAWYLPSAFALLLVVGLLIVGLMQRGTSDAVGGRKSGQAAPDFALTTFDGRPVRLADFRGRPLVLNFWASWCAPCRTEAPVLGRVAAAKADYVAFLGIDVRDTEDDARRFLAEYDVSYPNARDLDGTVEARYGGIGIPFTVFVAVDGTIERTWLGPIDERRLVAFVEEID